MSKHLEIPVLLALLFFVVSSRLQANSDSSIYEDPNFERPSTLVARSEEMLDKATPTAPGKKRSQWPKWEFRRIDDNVYSFRGSLHRSMVVITSGGVVVVDPMQIWSTEIMVEEIQKLTDKPITHVIYTHNHRDHIRGASVLKAAKPEFISHELAASAIAKFPHEEVIMPSKVWGGSKYEFQLGGENFELLYLGPNHGAGMTFVGLPDKKIMYICDVMSPGRLPPGLMPDFSPRGIVNTLSTLSKLDYKLAVNGHEQAAVSSWEAISATLGFYQDLRKEVLKAMQKTGIDIAPWEIVRYVDRLPKYENWRYYDQWYHSVAGRILMEEYLAW